MEPKETFYEQTGKRVTFKIQRFDPLKDHEPYLKSYTFDVFSGMTILDCLIYIKEKLDATLSFRASCRMGICGSCAMFINGFPNLACQTQSFSLNADVIEIRSLPNYPIIKDLVPDLTQLFHKHQSIKPYIIQEKEDPNLTLEYKQTPQELEDYLQFAYCLKCGICLSACPTVATDREFHGPQALAQAFRYNVDNRDSGREERDKIIDQAHGIWRCHMAGACAEACPKGVDPAMAIQIMKKQTVFGALGLRRKKKPAVLAELPVSSESTNTVKAPRPTVEKLD
jgi:succinate dehydrogenase / fumarate reductase iron-sulfur subunit